MPVLQGAVVGVMGEAFHCKFPKKFRSKLKLHINELELLAIIIAIKKFASRIENRNLLAYCDNQTSVEIVNSGAAKNQFAQGCLREICYLLAHQNAMIKMVHLSSAENRISDLLSRWQVKENRDEFYSMTTGTELTFIKVTEEDFEFMHDW